MMFDRHTVSLPRRQLFPARFARRCGASPRLVRGLSCLAVAAGLCWAVAAAAGSAEDRYWTLEFADLLKGGTRPMLVYARDRDGQWIAAVGSSFDTVRRKGKTFNKSFYCGDFSAAPIKDGAMKGVVKIHMTPDVWIPTDHKSFPVVLEVDAKLDGKDKLVGRYKVVSAESEGIEAGTFGKGGAMTGEAKWEPTNELPNPFTLRMNMQGAKVGGPAAEGNRCIILLIGMQDGKIVSTMAGDLDTGGRTYGAVLDIAAFQSEGNHLTADRDGFQGRIVFPSKSIDLEPCEYVFDLNGRIFRELVVGTYRLTAKLPGKPPLEILGSFDGNVEKALRSPPPPLPDYAPIDVKGFVPVKPGEHPRLLFRKKDLPALRARAQTPEGKAILARLRTTLGGNGETFPTVFSTATKGYDKTVNRAEMDRPGVFTLGHAAGYGLLYQLTGEQKYADLGRKAFEKMMEGIRDPDDRYSFIAPNGELRAGSSWAWAALGYDLCYDGWDADFRRKVVQAFLTVEIEQKGADLKKVVTAPKCAPSKNHFGGIICGAAAAAAIMGDPGTEGLEIEKRWMPLAYEHTRRLLTAGFGDHGFYAEGHGPSQVSSHTGLLLWLQAARNACGKDFISAGPNAQWLTLRLVMEIAPSKGVPQWLDRKSSAGPSYGTDVVERGRGPFAQGFGNVESKYVPAVLWTYQNFIEAQELKGTLTEGKVKLYADGWLAKGEKSYDVLTRPWIAVMAFVNWPIGVTPENPEKVLPKAVEDHIHGYYVFRNRWQDENDIRVSALLGYGPKDAFRPQWGPIYLWGFGAKHSFGSFLSDVPADFTPGPNGGVVSTDSQCLAVDFSGTSGAPALIALVGIEGPKDGGNLAVSTVDLGRAKVTVITMQEGKAPAVKVEGDKIIVGGQTIALAGKKIVFGK